MIKKVTVDPEELTTTCPSCGREHAVKLEQQTKATVECECGKTLEIQRGNGRSLVVREQAPKPS